MAKTVFSVYEYKILNLVKIKNEVENINLYIKQTN